MTNAVCSLCPRRCPVDRKSARGFCGAGPLPTVAKVMLHRWEEPCICAGAGAGAVFFAGCVMRCVFCQNAAISRRAEGNVTEPEALCSVFLDLQEAGASCLDLVSPTPHTDGIVQALKTAKAHGLHIPVVWNCGGYETPEEIMYAAPFVDVFLPDFKFFDPAVAHRLSGRTDYPEAAKAAINAMVRAKGAPQFEKDALKSGVLVRHLVLPSYTGDTEKILDYLFSAFGKETIVLSLMRQYVPAGEAARFPELNRRLTTLEYQRAYRKAEELGFEYLYTQKKESASEEFIPDFGIFCEKSLDK